jgi:hypothetical protein
MHQLNTGTHEKIQKTICVKIGSYILQNIGVNCHF